MGAAREYCIDWACPSGEEASWAWLQGHVKITACAELITVSGALWNTAAPECPAQSTFSLKCSLLAMVTFRYRCRT